MAQQVIHSINGWPIIRGAERSIKSMKTVKPMKPRKHEKHVKSAFKKTHVQSAQKVGTRISEFNR